MHCYGCSSQETSHISSGRFHSAPGRNNIVNLPTVSYGWFLCKSDAPVKIFAHVTQFHEYLFMNA